MLLRPLRAHPRGGVYPLATSVFFAEHVLGVRLQISDFFARGMCVALYWTVFAGLQHLLAVVGNERRAGYIGVGVTTGRLLLVRRKKSTLS
jgi:hypothetical protein